MENLEANMNNSETRGIEQMLGALNELAQEAWGVPFTGGKCLLDRERMLDLLEEIRVELPEELKQARAVLDSRAEIISTANREAENIAKAAQTKAMQLVDANAITVEANKKAKDILSDANNQAANILSGAQSKAKEMVTSAETRCNELRRSTGEYVESTMQKSVEAVTNTLAEMKKIQQQVRSVSGKL